MPLDREHVSALLEHALEEGATTSPLDEMIEEEAEAEGKEENFRSRVYCEDDSESDTNYDESQYCSLPSVFLLVIEFISHFLSLLISFCLY